MSIGHGVEWHIGHYISKREVLFQFISGRGEECEKEFVLWEVFLDSFNYREALFKLTQ